MFIIVEANFTLARDLENAGLDLIDYVDDVTRILSINIINNQEVSNNSGWMGNHSPIECKSSSTWGAMVR